MAPKQRACDSVVIWPHCFTGKLDQGPRREKELAERLVTFFGRRGAGAGGGFGFFFKEDVMRMKEVLDHRLGVLLAMDHFCLTDSAGK